MRSWLMAAAIAVSGCTPMPTPAVLAEPGVKVRAVSVERDAIAEFGRAAGGENVPVDRVMHLGWTGANGELLILTERGASWLDLATGAGRRRSFAHRVFRATPLSAGDGRTRVIGLSGRRDVPMMMLDGPVERVLRGDSYKVPLVADIVDSRAPELLLPAAGGLRVYSADGDRLGYVAAPWYASNRTFVQADGDPELEIAFVRTRGPAVEAYVVNADGSAVSHWRRSDGTWLSSVPSLGVDALWGVTARGFVAWDAFGREMDTYRAIGIGHMRDVAGVRSGGYVALVASGNGDRSLVAIYDRCRRLVYQEVYAGLTYTMAASPADDAIFVGAGERVLRYRLSPPPPEGLEACVGATERLLSNHAHG